MNTHGRFAIGALLLIVCSGAAQANGGFFNDRWFGPGPIVGTWRVTITPYNCATGAEFPAFAVPNLLSFGVDGTMSDITSNPRFQPGQRSSGLGSWERTGRHEYRAVLEAFIVYTTSPSTVVPFYLAGRQRFDYGIEFQDRNHWTSSGTVEFFDVGGNLVPPSGCANAVGVRFE